MAIADALSTLARSTLLLSIGIVVVWMLRPLARRFAGARVAYAIWLLPLALLTAPYLPASLKVERPAASTMVTAPIRAMERALPVVRAMATRTSVAPESETSIGPVLFAGWALGAALIAAVFASQQRRFSKRLGSARRESRDGLPIYFAETNDTGPAVVGALRPKIVVPADFDERYDADERTLVLAHERFHLRRRDPLVNAVASAFRCFFWFNPLVHLAGRALRLDQELACDAATMARRPGTARRYAEAMLKSHSALVGLPLGCYWPSPARHPLNQRIALLRHRPSPVRRIAGGTMILVTVLALELMAAPSPIAPASGLDARSLPPLSAPRPAASATMAIHAVRGVIAQVMGGSIVQPARDGDVERVRERLNRGGDVNEIVPGDGTPLIEAARRGQLDLARELLDRGADPNLAARGDGNPLIQSASRGHLAVVELLLQRGADVNGYVPDDETPLINAAGGGHLAVVRMLVEHGADVNLAYDVDSIRGQEHRSPLGQAVRNGHSDVAAYLRSAGAIQ